LLGFALNTTSGWGTTLYVDETLGSNSYDGRSNVVANGHGPKLNIANAISIASNGDVIAVAFGFYQETNWDLGTKSLTINPASIVTIYDSDPTTTDTDHDGIPDAWEVANGLNPFYNDAGEPSTNPFAHGLTNLQVYQNQSVLLADNYSTVGDGIPDWWKVMHGLSLTDPTVAFSDPDKDGHTNLQEYRNGTDPMNASSYPTNAPDYVCWWPFDEGSGTNTAAIGANLPGTLIGSPPPIWTNGIYSNALAFDGVSNEVVVANDPLLSPTNALSVMAWVKTATNMTSEVVAKWSTNEVAGSYLLSLTNGEVVLELMLDGTYTALVGTVSSLSDTNWHHIAGTYDGAEMRVYLDGETVGSQAASGTVDVVDAPLRLGLLAGLLDDVRLYQTALTSNGLAAVYHGDSDGDGMPDLWELQHGLNPFNPDDAGLPSVNPWAHGLTNLQVYQNPSVLNANNYSTIGDGIPDWWRVKYFGTTTNSASCASCDPDGDGLTNLQEYNGTNDPLDYYNGVLPQLSIVSGNDQTWLTNRFLPQPLVVSVIGTNGAALTNAPVTFAVSLGSGLMATSTNATPMISLILRTDTNGYAAAYFLLPGTFDTTNQITVTASSGGNSTQVVFVAQTYSHNLDTDGDGMPDWWEITYGLNPYSGISLGGTNLQLAGWWKLDETSGTNVANSTPGHVGGDGGAVNIDTNNDHVSGVISNIDALQFNGTNAYVEVPYVPAFTTTNGDISVSFWINRAIGGATSQPVLSWGNASQRTFWVFAIDQSNGQDLYQILFSTSTTGNEGMYVSSGIPSTQALRRGEWYQVTMTYHYVGTSSSIMNIYINGQLDSTKTNAYGPLYLSTPYSIWMGVNSTDSLSGPFFGGQLDGVRYYTQALNADQVLDLYEAFEDPDHDGLVNLQEYLHGTDPHNAFSDGTGMSDGWEVKYGLIPFAADPNADPDHDGLSNLQEYQAGTDPFSADTDGDGMPDGWEVKYGLNPTSGISLGGTNLQLAGWWKLDETSGTNVANSAPGHVGGDGGAVNIDTNNDHVSGVFSNIDVLQFNGTNAYVQIPHIPAFTTTNGDISLSFLINRAAPGIDVQPVLSRGDATNRTFWVYAYNGSNSTYTMLFTISRTGAEHSGLFSSGLPSVSSLQDGLWYQVAMTYHFVSDGSSIMNLYINGQLDNTLTNAFGPLYQSTTPIFLGRNSTDDLLSGAYFAGKLAGVHYYTQALQADQVADLYESFQDPDYDGLNNYQEFLAGTDPHNPDSNSDGIPDGLSITLGINPTNMDTDGDGLPNVAEIALGLNPLLSDWQAPPSNPSDHTPPAITLSQPANWTLVP
jgi:hypothetical protein